VEHYNNARLNSATGYITPKGVLTGHPIAEKILPTKKWRPHPLPGEHCKNDYLTSTIFCTVYFCAEYWRNA
jgi:hypothetical protein